MQKSRSTSLDSKAVRNAVFKALFFAPPLALLTSTILGAALIGSSASAMTVTGVDNSSVPIDLTLTPIQIYGGVAGTPGSGTGTSNSCANLPSSYAPCNPARVDATTVLRIHTNTTATTVGYPRIFYISGTSTSTTTSGTAIPYDSSNPPSAGAGDSYVAVKWGDICAAITDGFE